MTDLQLAHCFMILLAVMLVVGGVLIVWGILKVLWRVAVVLFVLWFPRFLVNTFKRHL